MKLRTLSLTLVAPLLVSSACKSKEATDNPDVAAAYRDNEYAEDIVTGKKRESYADQGKSISPKVLQSIEQTISNVYEKDFERCLERQMDEEGTRFMRSVFTVEFTIDTSGKASAAKILKIETRKQDAKGADLGAASSDGMTDCIKESITEWEFDPPPEVDYVHTYYGQVGEAF